MAQRRDAGRQRELRELMRLMVDVAALKTEPVTQRQYLIDGLQAFFKTKIGWLAVADNWRAGQQVILRHQVLASNAIPEWLQYMSDFSVNNPISADVYADHSMRSNATLQIWRRDEVLPNKAAEEKYSACVAMMKQMKLGDGFVAGYRTEKNNSRLIGVSLHRDENAPPFTSAETALFPVVAEEIRELEKRGHLEFREMTDTDLPPRLAQVLDRVLSGKSAKQMAAELRLSIHTVREHVQRLYKRYNVNSREDLTAKFLK
jgi:DNA-binding CsgD family transcriptional regulator